MAGSVYLPVERYTLIRTGNVRRHVERQGKSKEKERLNHDA